jgi:N-methylhydantoinase A
MGWRIGIDTGGTFTDVVAFDPENDRWIERKVWSRPGDPGGSLQAALESLDIPIGRVDSVVYGTTIVTNALIQGSVARVALLATKGFRDVLHIARQRRDVSYGLKAPHREPPLVPRDLCLEIDERCDQRGRIVRPVEPRAVEQLLAGLGTRAEVLAISFLHSYVNGANEDAVAALARRTWPFVCISHEVSPEAREYERTFVTVLNASLLPLMSTFVESLSGTNVPTAKLHLFHSAGGMVAPDTASRFPLLLAMSGPAAGVEAASAVARSLELDYTISFDMGGTTTDCSLIVGGRAEMQMDGYIGRHRVRQPMVAVESIGAGGGSIVRLTESGLQVGPDSAGADPGPACYLRGGALPTVTDAAAILGYFGTDRDLDRPVAIDLDAAARSYSPLARSLGLSLEETAVGAIRVGNAVAARAIKRITMGRGVDARTCSLMAFGGAGPMFACQLAAELGIRRVIIPFRSSALSAVGCLAAKRSFTRQKTLRMKEREFDSERLDAHLAELEGAVLSEVRTGGGAGQGESVNHVALMRYAGQSFDIEIPLPAPATRGSLTQAFRSRHQETYGYSVDEPWECVAIRTTGVGSGGGDRLTEREAASGDPVAHGETNAYFAGHGWCKTSEYRRKLIAKSTTINGPAIIADEFSTIVVPPDWAIRGADRGHVYIEQRHE